ACGDADGHPARSHAGARLGPLRGKRRHRRRADGALLSLLAERRRDLCADRLRRRHHGRLRQRARRDAGRPDRRLDPGALGLLFRAHLQGRHRLRPLRRAAVAPAARPPGNGVMRWTSLALAAALLLLYPWLVAGADSAAFLQDMGALVLLAAIGASAWNIIGGDAGQIRVGHAMFFGVGAYLPLIVYTQWQLPPLAGVPLGIAVSLVLALVVGVPTFRLVGHYFSMATIAVAELVRIV